MCKREEDHSNGLSIILQVWRCRNLQGPSRHYLSMCYLIFRRKFDPILKSFIKVTDQRRRNCKFVSKTLISKSVDLEMTSFSSGRGKKRMERKLIIIINY